MTFPKKPPRSKATQTAESFGEDLDKAAAEAGESPDAAMVPFAGGAGVMLPVDASATGVVSEVFNQFLEDVAGIEDADSDGYAETADPLTFCGIRQKTLVGESGEILRPAGAFRFGATKKPTLLDQKKLVGILLASAEVRTRFKTPDDLKPECGSHDMVQAEKEWGYKDEGVPRLCEGCQYNRHGKNFNGDTQAYCRENLQFYFYELQLREVICFQMTPGGRKSWQAFSSQIKREWRSAWTKNHPGTQPPREPAWITLIQEITPLYVKEKGGYYVPKFGVIGKIEKEQLAVMREQRRDTAESVEQMKAAAAKGGGMSAPDLLGDQETGERKGPQPAEYEDVTPGNQAPVPGGSVPFKGQF